MQMVDDGRQSPRPTYKYEKIIDKYCNRRKLNKHLHVGSAYTVPPVS